MSMCGGERVLVLVGRPPAQLSSVVCNCRGFKLPPHCSSSLGKLITIQGNFPLQVLQTFRVIANDVELTEPLLSCFLCKRSAARAAMGPMCIQGGEGASDRCGSFVVTAIWARQECISLERTDIGHGIYGMFCLWRFFLVAERNNAVFTGVSAESGAGHTAQGRTLESVLLHTQHRGEEGEGAWEEESGCCLPQ